jgi:uncharacterized protein
MTDPLESENFPESSEQPDESSPQEPLRSEEVWLDDSSKSREDELNSTRPPGPGVFMAFLWMLSVLIIHIAGILISGVVLFLTNPDVLQRVAKNPQAATKILDPFMKDNTFFMMAGEMLVFALAAVIVTRLKHGRQTSRVLGLRPIPLPSLILIVASVMPLSLVCSGLHQKLLPEWEKFAANYPALEKFSGTDINEQLLPLGETTPAWLLLLVIAVAPAVGEELIFRGIIGHGLVARHGLFFGVLITSAFFAAVHIHPAHVLTLIPLAVFLHLAWLSTRSFYAPVLIHFLNNALAVFVLKNAAELEKAAEKASEMEGRWEIIAVAGFALIPSAIAIWKNRVEFRLPDDTIWNPGYETAASPPAEVDAVPVYQHRASWQYAVGLTLCGGITLLFLISTATALLSP